MGLCRPAVGPSCCRTCASQSQISRCFPLPRAGLRTRTNTQACQSSTHSAEGLPTQPLLHDATSPSQTLELARNWPTSLRGLTKNSVKSPANSISSLPRVEAQSALLPESGNLIRRGWM